MSRINRLLSVASRTFRGFCPCCGKGNLFISYLKQVSNCEECREDFTSIRADDAPAWLTIFIVGHIVIPILFTDFFQNLWSESFSMLFWSLTALVMTLILLPRTKGLFIGIIWFINNPKLN